MEPAVDRAFIGAEYGPGMNDICLADMFSVSKPCEVHR